jgi:large subunit ribosomal protein L22
MNQAKAITKFVRVPPRKARLTADLIRGLTVEQAAQQLMYCSMKSGSILKKTLDSAIANGETQLDMRRERMVVSDVRVDAGPVLKRAKPKNKGGQHPIMKRTSHFTVVVSEGEI